MFAVAVSCIFLHLIKLLAVILHVVSYIMTLHRMEHLDLLASQTFLFCHLTRVGNEALIAIGQNCSLQHLNVSGCHQIGDSGIIAIARGCPELTNLDISVLQVNPLLPLYYLSTFVRGISLVPL